MTRLKIAPDVTFGGREGDGRVRAMVGLNFVMLTAEQAAVASRFDRALAIDDGGCDPSTIARLRLLGVLAPERDADLESIESILRPDLANSSTLRDQVTRELQSGRPCIIKNAFRDAFAREVAEALDRCNRWSQIERHRHPLFGFRQCLLDDRADFPNPVLAFERLVAAPATKRFMSDLAGVDCAGPADMNVTWYQPGQYMLPHSDEGQSRTVTFVWQLAEHWNPAWGGQFFWCSPPTQVAPIFNTLIVFRVTTDSVHAVLPVSPFASAKRLTISGWWTAAEPVTVRENQWHQRAIRQLDPDVLVVGD